MSARPDFASIRICVNCDFRWANEPGCLCRSCWNKLQQATPPRPSLVVLEQQRKPDYVPPHRDPVFVRNPWTSELEEFEIVWDGR
jgi:hypothetical protein